MNWTEEIRKALDIPALEHDLLVYESGEQYIEQEFGYLDAAFSSVNMYMSMMSAKTFWIWWKTQWNIRSQELFFKHHLNDPEVDLDKLRILRENFYEVHRPENIVAYPNKDILKDNYHELFHQVTMERNEKRIKATENGNY